MKISRPVLFILVAGVIGYAVVVSTEPDAAPHKVKKVATKSAQVDAAGFTKEDYTARFARYTARRRDPFQPKVMPHKTPTAAPASAKPKGNDGLALTGTTGTWTLTGISAMDGAQSALIENGSTHETVFLTVGEQWHNYHVVAIEEQALVLVDDKGKQVRLAFVEVVPTTNGSAGAAAGATLPGTTAQPPAPANGISTAMAPGTQRGR
jgi:hypothetical protein